MAGFNLSTLSDLCYTSTGLHTMWNEHFGISIVEMMAAGLAVVAHDSGGPRMDIVTTYKGAQTGYLASTSDEYAAILGDIGIIIIVIVIIVIIIIISAMNINYNFFVVAMHISRQFRYTENFGFATDGARQGS